MTTLVKKLLSFFSRRERFQIKLILVAVVLMGIMEVVGVASIMPFMAVVAKPAVIFENHYLNSLYEYFGFSSTNQYLFFLGVCVLLILTVNNGFSALVNWALLRFSNLRIHTLSERLLAGYLSQPYIFFLNRNSAELINNIFNEVQRVVSRVLIPLMQMITRLVTMLFVLGLLVAVNPVLALVVIAVLGSAYIVVYLLVRSRLARLGVMLSEMARIRSKAAFEALGGAKDLKLFGTEGEFLRRYSMPSRHYALSMASSQAITQLPRYAMEVIAFGGILVIVLYFLGRESDISEVLPLIALYAFAGYRMMPSLQQIYLGASTVRNNAVAVDVLYKDMQEYTNEGYSVLTDISVDKVNRLPFKNSIKLIDIGLQYPNTVRPVIQGINIEISANTTIGIVGGTGSGKTTLIDVILGLLDASSGAIEIDGMTLSSGNIRQWRMNLGYVPQTIYLSDDSISRNIAFGVPEDEIDERRVHEVARIANIDNFITHELRDGYNTIIGERGVRLSGGQRQRIGIARALYRDPSVLILDEATSALDGITEDAIMDAISALSHRKTIIMIAHRLTTVRECDVIYMLDNGRVTESGSYVELMESSEKFREMAKNQRQ